MNEYYLLENCDFEITLIARGSLKYCINYGIDLLTKQGYFINNKNKSPRAVRSYLKSKRILALDHTDSHFLYIAE